MAVTGVGIQAFAISAVCQKPGAAVAAVPIASADVVFVVAVSIALVGRIKTSNVTASIGVRVETVTLGVAGTIFERVRQITAVTTVPVTAAVIVPDVTHAVSFPRVVRTVAITSRGHVIWIQALARVAVCGVIGIPIAGADVHVVVAAAVTTVPVATAMVVAVVTHSVSHPTLKPARGVAVGFKKQVCTLAFQAGSVVCTFVTAIAHVPVATTVVVAVVTETVTLPRGLLALARTTA